MRIFLTLFWLASAYLVSSYIASGKATLSQAILYGLIAFATGYAIVAFYFTKKAMHKQYSVGILLMLFSCYMIYDSVLSFDETYLAETFSDCNDTSFKVSEKRIMCSIYKSLGQNFYWLVPIFTLVCGFILFISSAFMFTKKVKYPLINYDDDNS